MNTQEPRQVYGDSHTLDRPSAAESLTQSRRAERRSHPLDDPSVIEAAVRQGWGN